MRNSGIAGAAALLAAATSAQAGGFQAPELSVRAQGMSNAGAAALAGADALAWNPAAIARSGREGVAGLSFRQTSLALTDTGSTLTRPGQAPVPAGGATRLEDAAEDFRAPSLALALPVTDRIAVGLAVTKPFHLRLEYPVPSFVRYDLHRNRIEMTEVRAAIAVRAADWLDLGVSLDAQETRAALDAASPNLAPASPDALQQLTAKGWDLGWGAGAQARFDDLTLAVGWRSAIERDLDGRLSMTGLAGPLATANFDAPAKVGFSTPWTLTVAGRWQATPELALHAQAQRSGWSRYDRIDLVFAGQTAAIVQAYEDTTSVALGAEWRARDALTVRAGVGFDPTPTPDLMREPGVPDADRTTYALGATFALSPAVDLDLAAASADFDAARLNRDLAFYAGTPAASSATLRGDIDRDELTVGLAVRTRF
ncbi:OmpP1/FadL family transporter [Phenylobacterium sp.]|uniref:OmpP1/FadL family transporter n=1 Tax=Phenylobacterium sp. TaxID=1871053 RepID=UPI002C9EF23F|nr:porin [Phenylobacterium sp.]HVI30726.1 porin [Phenylobacterium sp.]